MKSVVRSAVLALVLMAAGGAPAQDGGSRLTVRMVGQPFPQLPQYVQVEVPLLEEDLPRKTSGRIEVDLVTWSQRNVAGAEMIRLVRSGQIDIAAAPLNTVSGDVALLDIADLGGLNPTIDQARRVTAAILPEANKELERFNTRIIATFPYGAQVFYCRDPVRSVADLKGKRIRTHGGSINDLVSALGGIPVAMAIAELYGALERGALDCAITGASAGNSARFYEVSKTLYTLTVSWSASGYFVNLGWWNKLDPAQRQVLEAQFKEVEDAQWRLGDRLGEDGIACNSGDTANCRIGKVVETRPMTVVRASDDDVKAVRAAFAETVLPAFVKRCGARCGDLYNGAAAPISGVSYGAR